MAAYEVLLLNTAIPQIQAAQSGDTYVVPRDIAFSAALTLTAGTANGVPYLNASKVLTTGSALTFDGTKLGVGVASAQAGVDIANSGLWSSGNIYNYPAGNAFVKIQGVAAQNNWIGIAGSYGQTTGSANLLLQANFNNTTQQAGHYIGSEAQSATSSDLTFGSITGGVTTGTNATKNELMRLTSTGLGIGTNNPGTRLVLATDDSATTGQLRFARSVDVSYFWEIGRDNNLTGAFVFSNASGGAKTERARISSDGTFRVKGAGVAGSTDAFQVAGAAPADAARITSGGSLLVGATTEAGYLFRVAGGLSQFYATAAANFPVHVWNSAASGDNGFVNFYTDAGATLRGSIDYDRTGGLVRYNTTSDYRAKDILGPVQNPGATIDALKVYEGRMKGATQSRPMLVAHEAQEHAPYAVTGEKDAVNEDGTPKYQQMDVSSLVPLLLAEIQSLRARVAQLEQGA